MSHPAPHPEPTPDCDYHRVARAIAFIEASRPARPSLSAVAQALDLSPAHAQRLFTRWAGVSPAVLARYLSYRTGRAALLAGAPVLEAALAAGLSGPGRLHDACVAFEALTPGQLRQAGAGETLLWGVHDSPFGRAVLFASPRGVAGLAFADPGAEAAAAADLMARWPAARFRRDEAETAEPADRLFGTDPPALHVRGTPFQIKVWEALLAIPPGATATYGAIAAALGSPKGARAVGTAVGANPVSWLIPCHRVLRVSGAMGGYHWGLPRKEAMLAFEALQAEARRAPAGPA